MRPLFLLCALFLNLLPAHGFAAAESVRLTNGEWPPYLGEQLPHYGVASRIVSEAFAHEGIEVQWEFYPWARALHLAEKGQRDGSAVWLYSPEREQSFYISDPVVESGHQFFHRKSRHFDWQTIDDLAGLRICVTIGYDYGQAFQTAEAEGRLQTRRVTSDEVCFRQLLAGRVDLFPIDKVVGYAMLYAHFSNADRAQLSVHHRPLRSDPLHLLLSRKVAENAERIRRFNLGLTKLRQNGRVAQYLLEIQTPVSLAP
jgi:polar amino acid transport system substrate-binding protein